MNSNDFLNEDIVTDAQDMHQDHEVQMARQECYHAAERAIAIHKLLRHINEAEGLEGWVSAKITLANDYLKTVNDYLEYHLMTMNSPAEAEVLPIAESQQGVAEGEKWIQKAVNPKTKGDLHKALHVPQDETIPKSKIDKATHSKNAHLRHMAQFAKNVTKEDASAGASSSGSVATVVKGGSSGTNLLGGPVYKGPNPFKKKKSK